MNIKLIAFLFIAFIYLACVMYEGSNQTYDNPDYQRYIAAYRKQIEANQIATSMPDNGLQYRASNQSGTTSNFEGPKVVLKAIKFHSEILNKESERLKTFDGVSALFDPDHAHFGLPDVKISVKDVRLFEPDNSSVASFLGLDKREPEPYRIYKKMLTDSTGAKKMFEMQLWLTEFEVAIDIRPDSRHGPGPKEEDDSKIEYPGFWYGLESRKVKLSELPEEHKDQRYSNLAFILEVDPNNSPIYVRTDKGLDNKADFAIAAIYCTKAIIGNEEKVQRINTNVHTGQPLFLNNEFDFEKMNENLANHPESVDANVTRIINAAKPQDTFIWNKPYYIKLHFTNLGTWRSGIVKQNRFCDQVKYSFLMPVFVVGSWDVIAPQEVLPEWAPPAPFIRKFTMKNLIPFWNTGLTGKIGVIVILLALVFVGLQLFVPGFGLLLKRLF